jgi:hypothetical protein
MNPRNKAAYILRLRAMPFSPALASPGLPTLSAHNQAAWPRQLQTLIRAAIRIIERLDIPAAYN